MTTDADSKYVNPHLASDHKRDAYGFSVRPQHVQIYREYVNIYKRTDNPTSVRVQRDLYDMTKKKTESVSLIFDWSRKLRLWLMIHILYHCG